MICCPRSAQFIDNANVIMIDSKVIGNPMTMYVSVYLYVCQYISMRVRYCVPLFCTILTFVFVSIIIIFRNVFFSLCLFQETLFQEFNTLAVVYGQPSSSFVPEEIPEIKNTSPHG